MNQILEISYKTVNNVCVYIYVCRHLDIIIIIIVNIIISYY